LSDSHRHGGEADSPSKNTRVVPACKKKVGREVKIFDAVQVLAVDVFRCAMAEEKSAGGAVGMSISW
jgi:hypothetical protein